MNLVSYEFVAAQTELPGVNQKVAQASGRCLAQLMVMCARPLGPPQTIRLTINT